MNVTDLEHALATPADPTGLGRPDLPAIRRAGVRRRRTRRAASAVTAVAAAGALAAGVLTAVGGSGGDHAVEPAGGAVDRTQLSEVAQRALDEIPGAVRISAWQVLVPGPGALPLDRGPAAPPEQITGEPVVLGDWYVGPTDYAREQLPAWLWDGVARIERTVLGDEETGYPVGSTDTGLVVDAGELELACMTAWNWQQEKARPDRPCRPAVFGRADNGERQFRWGMGTDDFLEPGAGMELFSSEMYVPGRQLTQWIGGVDGTDVVRADFTTTDGTVVEGRVSPGTLVPGESMFYAQVPGELANVTIYDSRGEVLESHDLEPCSDPVDCEVR